MNTCIQYSVHSKAKLRSCQTVRNKMPGKLWAMTANLWPMWFVLNLHQYRTILLNITRAKSTVGVGYCCNSAQVPADSLTIARVIFNSLKINLE